MYSDVIVNCSPITFTAVLCCFFFDVNMYMCERQTLFLGTRKALVKCCTVLSKSELNLFDSCQLIVNRSAFVVSSELRRSIKTAYYQGDVRPY